MPSNLLSGWLNRNHLSYMPEHSCSRICTQIVLGCKTKYSEHF
jgi:hypothetical protein